MNITTRSPRFIRSLRTTFMQQLCMGAIALAAFSTPAAAQTIYALSGSDIISFNALAPAVITGTVTVTGIASGQSVAGMDYRPATGQLYALGYNQTTGSSQLYTINTSTGAATAVNATPVALAANLGKVSFDFNPTVDRIRVTGSNEANYRLNPNNGAIAAADGTLAYAAGDANAGADPSISAGAYTNSYIASTSTTLYNYDDSLNIFTTQNPPNAGTLNTVGSSGLTADRSQGTDLDIFYNTATSSNVAYFAARATGTTGLYQVNLTTGTATFLGTIGLGATAVNDIAVFIDRTLPAIIGQLVYAVTTNNNLISFDNADPTAIRAQLTVSGLMTGQVIEGLDFRPATGELYALGYNSANGDAQLYTINTATGVATAVGAVATLALGTGPVGFDFNPTVDRIRVVGANDANYRLHPTTGAIAATDGTLAYAAGDANSGRDPQVTSVAYINSFAGAFSTSLYDYDDSLDAIVLQNPPNAGTLTTVGASGLTGTSADIDIYFNLVTSQNEAYLGSTAGNFYSLNLTTGTSTIIGRIGNGVGVKDIAVLIDSIPPVTTGIADGTESTVAFRMYPNPAKNIVYMSYGIKESSHIQIAITDITGRQVAAIDHGTASAGAHQATWTVDSAPGMYLVQVCADGKLQHTDKLIIK